MAFSDKEVESTRSIFIRIEPGIVESIQFHSADSFARIGYTFGVKNKKRQYIFIYQNFRNLSPFRIKLLMKLSNKIIYPLHIEQIRDDIKCIGWKHI